MSFYLTVSINICRSGVEEAFTEKDRLLEEVSSLCKEANYSFKQPRKKSGLSKEQQLCELGKQARNKFAADYCTLEDTQENISCSKQRLEENNNLHVDGDHNYCKFLSNTWFLRVRCI